MDEQNVFEAHQAGNNIIILERVNASEDLSEIYKNLQSIGIPSVKKFGNEFAMTEKITDLLAKVFTSPSQT